MSKRLIKSREYFYTVIYKPVRGGGYEVGVPLLRGLVTYGRNLEEARKMAKDAIRCYLEGLLKEKEPIPKEESILEEKITVSV